MIKYPLSVLFCFCCATLVAQVITPDLYRIDKWKVVNRKVEMVNEKNYKSIRFNEVENDGMMILNETEFSEGTIEFDVKGKNLMGQSFVGVAFHLQDENKFDGIYFRPFNFMNPDTIRRWRAVQYHSSPDYPWDKLREQYPGKYENKINPVPDADDWFHTRIDIEGKNIKVYVNNAAKPTLEVEKISTYSKGKIALWVGNNSGGSFANLVIKPKTQAKKISYGNYPEAGNYFDVGDAKLYYEVYGKGEPFVLLHGGVYGYIDEFENFITRLAENYQVICIATRGHGKSEAGTAPFTWQQRADDAYKVIRSLTKDSVTVLGFSDGGYSGYKLAASHPELVKKLIVIGAGDRPANRKVAKSDYTPEKLLSQAKEYFESRLAIMPEPQRWGDILSRLNKLYDRDLLSVETFKKIKCPTLVMAGDRDDYQPVEGMTIAHRNIKNSSLAIIGGCHHVVFFCNMEAVWHNIGPFLDKKR
jgi:pimeloyl-ACP methyl ester carboxylesterase